MEGGESLPEETERDKGGTMKRRGVEGRGSWRNMYRWVLSLWGGA